MFLHLDTSLFMHLQIKNIKIRLPTICKTPQITELFAELGSVQKTHMNIIFMQQNRFAILFPHPLVYSSSSPNNLNLEMQSQIHIV
jgi:hypothetical protein